MSWLDHHKKSEGIASSAEIAFKKGRFCQSINLYKMAAQEETIALSCVDSDKKRTIGITVVSAASLWYKGREFQNAQEIAYKWLSTNLLPEFAVSQLQQILQKIWNEIAYEQTGIKFVKGDILVSLAGGLIVNGAAPLDLVNQKVDGIRNICNRTVEMLLKFPFRKRGLPDPLIQEQFRPWLLQTPPGSYQFAIRIQKPAQMSLFPGSIPEIDEITNKVLEIIGIAAEETHEKLKDAIANPDYRKSFLQISRNLAPSGRSFKRLEIRSTADGKSRPIVFYPMSRRAINITLKETKEVTKKEDKVREEQLSGILRGLHLDKDWLEVNIPERDETIRIFETGDVIDDIVGPMVNHRVLIDVAITQDGRHIFRDIQPDE